MTNLAKVEPVRADVLEVVLGQGDLSRLTPEQRVKYYMGVCESVGLNPLTRPFEFLSFQGKTILYAKRDATDQVRAARRISASITSREKIEDLYVVTCRTTTPDGRTDESTGVVMIGGLKGEALANAFMRAETKAKRRATLSIVGLGMLDESELDTMKGARSLDFDITTGEVNDGHAPRPQLAEVASPEPPPAGLSRQAISLRARLLGARTEAEVKVIATEIKAAGFGDAEKAVLAEAYASVAAALGIQRKPQAAPAPCPPPPEPLDPEPTPEQGDAYEGPAS